MHILITGASGSVGRFLANHLLEEGHLVTALGRTEPKDLPVSFSGFDLSAPSAQLPRAHVLLHCALEHEPGKFRGGEGDDPDRFWRLNVEGTKTLFHAAKDAGCRHAVFLSSRAVYGDHRAGERLFETDEPAPDTLYGKVKLAGESVLSEMSDPTFRGTALRATGVYGQPPGATRHKWSDLFDSFLAGQTIDARCGSELHGDDLAAAVSLLIDRGGDQRKNSEVFNVSDFVIDRAELLSMLKAIAGRGGEPPRASRSFPGEMDTAKLKALGWQPGGIKRLRAFLEDCVDGC